LILVLLALCIKTEAKTKCFIVSENNKIIHQEGNCYCRYAPCSTFKIAISLMGYDAGFLINEDSPTLPFKNGYVDWLDQWKQDHTPRLWLKNSCVWYSQIITQHLGMEKFKNYVEKLDYGNGDVSGDLGKKNGLTNCWLSSSLRISPHEQIVFLQKLLNNQHPVSTKAQETTKHIMFVEDLENGWKLYGKTGNGHLLADDHSTKLERQIGWFVGWIEKEGRQLVFAYLIVDEDKQETYASYRAKNAVKHRIIELVKSS
jgi:beta-lactamase class D